MRVILAFLLLGLSGICSADWQRPVVDLNRPGVLDQVARENPDHHRRILEIIRTVQETSCERALKLYRTRLDLNDLACSGYQVKTSWPAKRHLGFTLDGTRYMKFITLDVRGEIMPVR